MSGKWKLALYKVYMGALQIVRCFHLFNCFSQNFIIEVLYVTSQCHVPTILSGTMVKRCCAVRCTNRYFKGEVLPFPYRPRTKAEMVGTNGQRGMATKQHSAHFIRGMKSKILLVIINHYLY